MKSAPRWIAAIAIPLSAVFVASCASKVSPGDFMTSQSKQGADSTSFEQQYEPRYAGITDPLDLQDLITSDLAQPDGAERVGRGLNAFLASARLRNSMTVANAIFKKARVIRLLESTGGRAVQTQASQIQGILEGESEEELASLNASLRAADFETLRSALDTPDGILGQETVGMDRSLLLKRKTYLLAVQLHDVKDSSGEARDAALDETIQTLEETAVWSGLSGDTEGRIALSVMAASALEERDRSHEAMEHWLRIADSSGFSELHPELQADVIQKISSYHARLTAEIEAEVDEAHRSEVEQLTNRFEGIIAGMDHGQQVEIARLSGTYEPVESDEPAGAWLAEAASLTSMAADRLGAIQAEAGQWADDTGLSSIGASEAWQVTKFALKMINLPRRGAFRVVHALL